MLGDIFCNGQCCGQPRGFNPQQVDHPYDAVLLLSLYQKIPIGFSCNKQLGADAGVGGGKPV